MLHKTTIFKPYISIRRSQGMQKVMLVCRVIYQPEHLQIIIKKMIALVAGRYSASTVQTITSYSSYLENSHEEKASLRANRHCTKFEL